MCNTIEQQLSCKSGCSKQYKTTHTQVFSSHKTLMIPNDADYCVHYWDDHAVVNTSIMSLSVRHHMYSCVMISHRDAEYSTSRMIVMCNCTWNLSVPLVCHGLSADASILPQDSGVGARVSALQEGNVRLTHCDVLWRCVGMKLLVPCLQKLALYALRVQQAQNWVCDIW